MADKYESRITADNALEVILSAGPAAGTYKVYAPKVDREGKIYLATITVAGRKDPVMLKISASENPEMVAKIAEIDARLTAEAMQEDEASDAEEILAAQMHKAGFGASGVGERLIIISEGDAKE